jgi:hypothetical protein
MTTITRLVATALALVTCVTTARAQARAKASTDGWISLFDGRTLAGWRASENVATFSVRNGEIVVRGPRAHLFYDGPVRRHAFTDFELKVDVLTKPGANSGIYLRTAFQPNDWPSQGYEVQVNNSFADDWRRTGSLYEVRNLRAALEDDTWFTVHAIVRGRRVRVLLNGKQVVDYTEPAGTPTRLTGGTIALQGHDPGSEVHYRNVMIRPLAP